MVISDLQWVILCIYYDHTWLYYVWVECSVDFHHGKNPLNLP